MRSLLRRLRRAAPTITGETSPLILPSAGISIGTRQTESESEAAYLTPEHSYGTISRDERLDGVPSPSSIGNAEESSNNSFFSGSIGHSIRDISQRVRQVIEEHTGSIGMLGSFAIAVNSLTGPAMLTLPATFARSGIIPTIATLVFVCILSSLCSLHMANAISKVPNNLNFKKNVEYSDAFNYFWGREWFLVTQVIFFCCVTCLNISSIVDTAQVIDTFLGHWWPGGQGTAAIHILGWQDIDWIRWDYSGCSQEELVNGDCIPFQQEEGILITAGNILVTLLFLPLAQMDLKENASWQIGGFLVLLVTASQFIIQFCMFGLDLSHASWWGSNWDDLLGVVLFNFALVIAVPAWLYEREPTVDVPTVIHGSSIMSAFLYITIGMLGYLAMPNVSDNMLESMMSGAFGTLMQLGASIFAFAIIGLGIPLFSVLTRLNLVGNGLCSERTGNMLSVYFPFAISWLLYDGTGVTKLLGWGGVIFTSLVVFVLPLALAFHVVKDFPSSSGSIKVYSSWMPDRMGALIVLGVLIFLGTASVVVAIVGNFVGS